MIGVDSKYSTKAERKVWMHSKNVLSLSPPEEEYISVLIPFEKCTNKFVRFIDDSKLSRQLPIDKNAQKAPIYYLFR